MKQEADAWTEVCILCVTFSIVAWDKSVKKVYYKKKLAVIIFYCLIENLTMLKGL